MLRACELLVEHRVLLAMTGAWDMMRQLRFVGSLEDANTAGVLSGSGTNNHGQLPGSDERIALERRPILFQALEACVALSRIAGIFVHLVCGIRADGIYELAAPWKLGGCRGD